jgi:uncharacterized membrane protein
MLVAFGVYWTVEGLGMAWPGGDFAILALAAIVLILGRVAVFVLRRGRMRLAVER